MPGSNSGVVSSFAFGDVVVHIAHVDKVKQPVQHFKIVRMTVSHYRHAEVNCCVDAILEYCIGPDVIDILYPIAIYSTPVLVLGKASKPA
jgi:hypothetical protein